MSNLLEQAIVDAKALKDAAFNSAKDALVEKYAPEIKEAVNNILEQDDEEEELGGLFGGGGLEPDMGQGEVSGVSDNMPLAATDGENLCACPDEEEEIEIDFDALEKQMRAEEEGENMGHDDLATGMGLDMASDEEEFELEESELFSMLQEDSVEEAVKLSPEYMKAKKEREAKKKAKEKDSEEKVEEACTEEEKPSEMMESKNLEATLKKTVLSETKKIEKGLLKENKALLSENKSLVKENKVLKDKNEVFKSKIIELSEVLEEVNLNNAKLLYKNEVLKSVSLNERQKDRVVEAISRAGTVDEAKTIYETLINSVGSSSEKKRPESLSEVVKSKRTGIVNRQPQTINPEKSRWQALAGIKK